MSEHHRVTASEIGRTGGRARAAKLSPERRKEIAQNAAQARWALPKPGSFWATGVGKSPRNPNPRVFERFITLALREALQAWREAGGATLEGEAILLSSMRSVLQDAFCEPDRPTPIDAKKPGG